MDLSGLSDVHIQEIIAYLEFEKTKRVKILQEMSEEINDHLTSRIDERLTYTGQELSDALEDLPDMIDMNLDSQLEHQRDMTMVLLQKAFEQMRKKNAEVSLNVAHIEDEKELGNVHNFCEKCVATPEEVVAAAPKAPKESKSSNKIAAKFSTGDAEIDKLLQENEEMKNAIKSQLEAFPQYKKTLEMIREREIEVNGLKTRL